MSQWVSPAEEFFGNWISHPKQISNKTLSNEIWRSHFVWYYCHQYSFKKVWGCSGEPANWFIWKWCNRFQNVCTAFPTASMDILAIVWIRRDVMYSNDTTAAQCSWCFPFTCWCATDRGIITYSQRICKALTALRLANIHYGQLWCIRSVTTLSERALVTFILYNNQMVTLFSRVSKVTRIVHQIILSDSLCIPERLPVWLHHPLRSALFLRPTGAINGAAQHGKCKFISVSMWKLRKTQWF